ncbi:MAG: magnesium/cobalt transporter CorA [Fusobacteriaceae bacterium]
MKKNSKRHKKIGMEPGSIIYTGNKLDEKITIELFSYNDLSSSEEKFQKIEDVKLKKGYVNWLNIDGVHDTDIVKKIGERFKIDSMILEDIASINQRAKLEEREDFIYIVIKMFRLEGKNNKIVSEQVSLIVNEEYLITFQEEAGDVFDNIRQRIGEGLGKVRKKRADYLAYLVLDAIIDNYFNILEKLEYEMDELEDKLINASDKDDLKAIMKLKHEFITIKRSISPVRDLTAKMFYSRDLEIFRGDMSNYINDLHDHVIVIQDIMENLSARVVGLVEIYHSSVNSVMNETMRFLTIVSTIFVPLTFLAGIYGMNFQYMPELSWKFSYFTLLGIMFVTGCGMVYHFKKKKWF